MNALKWLIAGLIGGSIGAVVWALLYHYANFESGIIAWGIGALAGVCVRTVSHDNEGFMPGSVAVIAAILALCCGKVGGLYLDLNGNIGPEYRAEEREFLTSIVASGIVIEHRLAGNEIEWPKNADIEFQNSQRDFPKEIWSDAKQRYDGYSATQLEAFQQDPSSLISEEFVITFIADEVAGEWEAGGRQINWPDGAEPYSGDWSGDYPTDVWDESRSRWGAMSSAERVDLRQMILPPASAGLMAAIELVPYTFTYWDMLWFGLALFSAYKIGANEQDD